MIDQYKYNNIKYALLYGMITWAQAIELVAKLGEANE